ncbi:MAG: OmpA family protein [Ghiorsea sp.]
MRPFFTLAKLCLLQLMGLMLCSVAHAAPILPLGDLSFADEVVLFIEGSPAARSKAQNLPSFTLGAASRKQPSLTLGCGGVLVVRFTDNALVDGEGDDLYVYEIGPNIEATQVDISRDGYAWVAVGKVAGATASLDIRAYVKAGQSFSYVRLTDLKQSCDSSTPGADIDAIAAIGSVKRYHFSSAVLFDFDQASLKAAAKQVLQQWVADFEGTSGLLQVNGHTDQRGEQAYNLLLSQQRAQAVVDFLRDKVGQSLTFEARGLGESQPLLTHDESSGDIASKEAKNRRVEILYFP